MKNQYNGPYKTRNGQIVDVIFDEAQNVFSYTCRATLGVGFIDSDGDAYDKDKNLTPEYDLIQKFNPKTVY